MSVGRNAIRWVLVGLVTLVALGYSQIFGFTQISEVKKGTYLIYNTGGLSRIGANVIAFDAGDAWVAFDTHLGPLANRAAKRMKSINAVPVALALNSHWHPDHSGGNAIFTVEANIVAHENVKRRLAEIHEGFGLTKPGSYRKFDPVPQDGLPEFTIVEEQQFAIGTLKVRAKHYPNAHTDGDIVLFADDSKIVALGDLVWPNSFPFIDVRSGGTVGGLQDSLTDILEHTTDDYLYLPGHGDPITKSHLVTYIDMISETKGFVAKQKAAGIDLAAIQTDGLPQKWRSWGSNLIPQEEWIRIVYETM